MFLSEWRKFPSAPGLAEEKNVMKAGVSMLLQSRASLTCFRACFLPGQAKDLPAPRDNSLSAFEKLRNATTCFLMSVRLSTRMEQLGSHRTDFHEI